MTITLRPDPDESIVEHWSNVVDAKFDAVISFFFVPVVQKILVALGAVALFAVALVNL